jgi:hypothetical protein
MPAPRFFSMGVLIFIRQQDGDFHFKQKPFLCHTWK